MNIHAHKQVFIHVLVINDNVDNKVKYFQAEEDCMVSGSGADVGNEIRKLHVLGSGITGLTKSRSSKGGVRLTTSDEIKKELVDLYSNLFGNANVTGVSIEKLHKASDPDGVSADFYKKSCGIMGVDVTEAVLHFFQNGKILKVINSTSSTLVPKVRNASKALDFRPISCCFILYKCISKSWLIEQDMFCLALLVQINQLLCTVEG
ncbi:PREDICTED: uncharacterized protein LOC105137285 [Populus euphratica]|uniref:Uncharacterized protein LOC105137285 n=1 Tax=Populus euphratica TaxID=75702 RepID=A0AAJ6V3R9_POPEU|nr:PREDICTED: uncharacterized protein LOC105137285 [Populus euphratica]